MNDKSHALREAEKAVVYWQRAHDSAEHAYLSRKYKNSGEREQSWQVYQHAARKLQNALDGRDRLLAKAGRHPYLNLIPRLA